MKKIVLALIILLAVVVTGHSQSGVIESAAQTRSINGAAHAANTGVIDELTGEVELKLAGASAFVPAQKGSPVAMDTIVSTSFRSTAIILVGNTKITVRPLTRLSLSEIQSSANEENLNVNLQTGRVRVEVKPPAGTKANTTVRGPSSTASVRGTVFDMDNGGLNVIEGRVLFTGSDGLAASVPAGFSSEISSNGAAINPAEIAEYALLPPAPEGSATTGESSPAAGPAIGDTGITFEW